MAILANVPDNFQEVFATWNQFDGGVAFALIQFQKITCAIAGTRRCRRIKMSAGSGSKTSITYTNMAVNGFARTEFKFVERGW